LFGGDVLPHPHFGLSHLFTVEHTVHLPCHGGTVVLGPLESYLFAWTFWQLHDAGCVELALEQPQATRRTKDDWLGLDVSVCRTPTETNPDGVLAEELLAYCSSEPALVSSVIFAWGKAKGVDAQRMVYLPLDAIVELIHLDTCNYLGVEPLPPSKSRLDCDEISLYRTEFANVRRRFGHFADGQTDLATALLRCCDAGLYRLRPPKFAPGAFGP
jgi:hypothetical protein